MKTLLDLCDLHFRDDDKYGLEKLKFDLLQFVLEAFKQQVDFIRFGGDIYHSNSPSITLQVKFAQCLLLLKDELRSGKLQVIITPGNHDFKLEQYMPDELFQMGASLGDFPVHLAKIEPLVLDGGNLVFRGFSKEPIPDGLGRFFLGHQPVGYKNEKWFETGAQDLLKLSYERIILGDIHQRHDVENKLHSVGTMFPSSFSDEGLVGCFGILKYEEGFSEFKRMGTDPSNTYPVFHTINVESVKQDFSPWDIKGNIIKLRIKGTLDENTQRMRETLRDELLAKGARYVQIENLGYSGQEARLPSEILTERELIKQRAKSANWPKEVETEFERRLG